MAGGAVKHFVQFDKIVECICFLFCQNGCGVIVAYNVHVVAGGDCPRA